MQDRTHKIRRDVVLSESSLIETIRNLFFDRVFPQIQRAYQYRGRYMERFIIACYDSKEGAHFAPHRDNTTSGHCAPAFCVNSQLKRGL